MKAKRENIINRERNDLAEVLPLKWPYALVIDPSNLCNFRCKFCWQCSEEAVTYKKQFMEIDLFKKIINDLSFSGEKVKSICLSGQGEPLLNPNILEMIQYTKEREVSEFIEIITNGSKFSPEFNQKLVNSGVDRIRISVEELSETGYLDMAGVNINFEEFVANIKDLYERSRGKCTIYIKIVDASVKTQERKIFFYDTFGNYCDKIWIDAVIPLWSDFQVIDDKFERASTGIHGQKIEKVNVCPFPFYKLIINPDGEVTLCCADWKRKLVVGNLSNESFERIWNGKILREFWCNMLKGKKNQYEMCKKCVLPMFDCNDNIDECAEKILKRIEHQNGN